MPKISDVTFVVNPKKEKTAVYEANKLGTPVVAMVDTNTDPILIDVIIPVDDDTIRVIHLTAGAMADVVIEGKQGEDDENVEQEVADKTAESTDEKSMEEIANEADEDQFLLLVS